MAHSRHTPWREPHISEIEEQIKWEMDGIERGAKRVHDQAAEQSVGDNEVGLKIMRHVAPRLVEKIKAAQQEAADGIAAKRRGKPHLWWWLILLFDPTVLAVIVLKTVLTDRPREFTFKGAVSSLAAGINRNAWTQLDFDLWKQAEQEKDDSENQYLRFLWSTKKIGEKEFKRFSERIQREKIERWDYKVGIAFGCKLLQLLCEAVPEWFSIETNRLRGGRMELQLAVSEEAKETIADITQQCELSRPMLLPMICPPADWRKAA